MNLIDALNLVKGPAVDDAEELSIFLVCGFTPLHLHTHLDAHMRQRFPLRNIRIDTGVFGNIAKNLQRALGTEHEFVTVAIEWSDIDARLGIRIQGTWRANAFPDVLESAERQVERLKSLIAGVAAQTPCAVVLPTLPLPPIFPRKSNQSGPEETRLRQLIADFASSLTNLSKMRLLSAQALDEVSPLHNRQDVRSEIMSVFPYGLSHCEELARLLTELIQSSTPKKGLIADLDGTLWSRILGGVGIENICWDLGDHALPHGLYQQFLGSLANAGYLLSIASKNDPALANSALEQRDLLISKSRFFPIECHWSGKSESLGRILEAWNVAADAVIFVDDNPMEVAEVQTAFPRLNLTAPTIESQDDFLKEAEAVIVFESGRAEDARAFELINKTNQFNLTGRRLTEAQWVKYLRDANTFLLSVRYEDRYGRLGKIATIVPRHAGERIPVDFWVISCRAFSRRIQHHCLKYLFEKFHAIEGVFAYEATEHSGPLREFCRNVHDPLSSPIQRHRDDCMPPLPDLFHRIQETVHD